MKREEQEYWLYEQKHESVDEVFAHLSNIAKHGRKVNFALITSKADIIATLNNGPEGYKIEIKNSGPIFALQIVRVLKEEGMDHTDKIKVLCIKLDAPFFYLLISDYKPALFKALMLRLVNHNYPLLSRVFLRHSELFQLFGSLKEAEHIETIVRRALFYSRIENDVQEKDLKWTRRPFEEVFQRINEQNGWIRKIDFKSYQMRDDTNETYKEKKLEGAISSDFHFVMRGNFGIFNDYFLTPAIGIANERFGYLKSRSDSAGERLPEPIVIKFDEPVFREVGWTEKFIDIMADLKNASVTQYHINPYIHVSVVDYQDGSSYGIWVVSDDEINLVPQVRASVASMNRLLNHIYERISEGEVAKYVPLEVSTTQ